MKLTILSTLCTVACGACYVLYGHGTMLLFMVVAEYATLKSFFFDMEEKQEQ